MSHVLIVGGGVIGLATAVELRLRGADVTLLTRGTQDAAAYAAAGMLAPHAEALPPGPLLDFCCRSLSLYPDWIAKLEHLSGMDTGYWPCGILAPQYKTPLPADPDINGAAPDAMGRWLDRTALEHLQPGLGDGICGGWWFPEDGQVDNRLLLSALLQAAQTLGVAVYQGVTVTGLQQQGDRIVGLRWSGEPIHKADNSAADLDRLIREADQYVITAGAWVRQLLPLPVQPCKGEMLAVRAPQAIALQQVLYGPGIYIVPRRDGRIVIGATMEPGRSTPSNTPGGIHSLLERAIRLYPVLETYPIEEMWWGFRPQTPDELPIIGQGHCPNLTLAVGHHRNGVLMAPATATLVADHICPEPPGETSHSFNLDAFSWRRFLSGEPASAPPTAPYSTTAPQQPSPPTAAMPQLASPSSVPALSNGVDVALDPLVIAGRTFNSRLMTGTGKYRNFEQMRQAIAASGCEIVTVAVRRVQTAAPGHEGLAEALDWEKLWMLPNTAGCKTAEDAVRVARLGREMAKLLGQEDNNFVKLEVIPDSKYLLPDPIGTLEAAEQLVKEGFAVLPYINADPLLARRLEEAGCATVMPLGSPIGSGQGIKNAANIAIIVESATVPVVVDAGIGTPSEAAQAMELGADALLINTAIAQAENPAAMARAMGMAAEAGWLASRAGRIPVKTYASASSPQTGTI
ncbi:MAG: glycine oxidase ThiO [Cyanobacteria bacterium P01_A01_bin.135]